MRRLKNFFDFKFKISVKLSFEWCMMIYDSIWFRLRFLDLVYSHAYANLRTWEISRWIIYHHTSFEWKFYADFEFEVKKISAYAFKRKSRFKNLRWRFYKIFIWLNSKSNFHSKYMHILIFALSWTLEFFIFEKSNFCNYVIWRYSGTVKFQSG